MKTEMFQIMMKERSTLYDYIELLKSMLKLADDKMETMQKLIDVLEEKSVTPDNKHVCEHCRGQRRIVTQRGIDYTVTGTCPKCKGEGVV